MASQPPDRRPPHSSLSAADCHLFVESLTDYALFMLERDGRIASWNRGAEVILGHSASQIAGAHFSRLFSAEDSTAGKPERELQVAAEFGRAEEEGWRVRKDDSRFWANMITTAIRDERGELRGFGVVMRDVTAKRLAEAELRESEQRFHGLVDAVVDYAIFILDAEGHVSTWNAGAKRLKGYSASEIIGEHFSVFYTPEARAAHVPERLLERVRREGHLENEGWRVKKDGSRFWANVVISALRDTNGAVTGFAKVTRDLTERRASEDALRKSEERFRLMVENIGDYAIYMLDTEGHVSTWNVGAERLKGYSAEAIIGQNFSVFFPAADVAAGKPTRELEAAREQGRFEDEGWRIRKDGSRFWANAVITALHDDGGELLGFAKITRDLTARRETEEKARQLVREQAARAAAEEAERRIGYSEERYRALSGRLKVVFEGVADVIMAQDQEGKVVVANTAAADAFGFNSPEELMRASAEAVSSRFDLLDRDDEPSTELKLRSADLRGGSQTTGGVLHLRDRFTGVDRWVSTRNSTVSGGGGEPELAITIWHDVTAERRQERQARLIADATVGLSSSLDEREMLSALATALIPGVGDWCSVCLKHGERLETVALIHRDGTVPRDVELFHRALVSAEVERGPRQVSRTGQMELLDLDDAFIGSLAHDAAEFERLARAAPQGALFAPIKLRGKVLGVVSFFLNRGMRRHDWLHAAVVEEICRRAAGALENARLYAAAQQAAANAEEASRAKDEFLATVSHELRTPLTAILGWARLLQDRTQDPALAKPVEVIHRNAQAQAKIIDDILDVSRVITGKFRLETKATDLVAVVRDALEVVRPSALAKRVTLEFVTETSAVELVVDPERLQQAIWNLLSNAVKFTEANGTISVLLRPTEANVTLSVTDTGAGIEPSFLPFVFERFKQADATTTRRKGGLGLGLAIVRHIVELHGGRVAATSEGLGKGATFSVVLPLQTVTTTTTAHARPSSARAAAPLRVPLSGLKTLIVEDDDDAREFLVSLLTERGAEVASASSSSAGLQLLRELQPDVVVSDIGMPGEDGYSFITRVRALPAEHGGDVPALALTAFAREDDQRRALAAGYTMHLGKPIDPETLSAVVARLGGRGP